MPKALAPGLPHHPNDATAMTDQPENGDNSFQPPKPADGFHEPADQTRRRNLITAGIIAALVLAWILLGLRRVLF